ncbi:hypothetical protein [Dyella terrae]|uniref:hypothetical protein n=1 Tax=Dyella terrae TaxID=522259 RepID=UPI001EFD31E1|nr:hypothetical protein [Dyella terrae]
MTPTDSPEPFIVRPSPGLRLMSLVDALTVLLLMALASMMVAAMALAAPGSGDWFGLLVLAALVAVMAFYRAIKGIIERSPLVVAKDGRATRWQQSLPFAQPQRVSLEYKYKLRYRTFIEYGNGRLLARLDQADTRAAEAFAVELAEFLGVSAYKSNDSGQKPRKLSKKVA